MKAKLFTVAAAGAILAMSGAAMAQQTVHAATDLDVRAGPGPGYPIVGVIGIDREAVLLGCDDASGWCEIDDGRLAGWADANYLDGLDVAGDVYINEGRVDGGLVGSISAQFAEPAPPVVSYIEENPYDPYYFDGEVVVGATLPETVEVYEIPDYEYRYVYVNDRPVLVEPGTNRIVYIVR